MNDTELLDLKNKHRALLALCGGGADRRTPPADSKLTKARSERDFCAIVVLNQPEASFLAGAFGIKDEFIKQAENPPATDGTQENGQRAQTYLFAALQKLRDLALAAKPAEIERHSFNAVHEHATEFASKLVNSDAQAPVLVNRGRTGLPHLSSRRLIQSGFDLPLDQIKNDNTGAFQRILKLLKDDDIVRNSKAPQVAIDAVKAGAVRALEARAKYVDKHTVDHRLRQILLPAGDDGYVAVSPLPATGIAVLLRSATDALTRPAPEDASTDKQGAEGAPVEDKGAVVEKHKARFTRLQMPFGGSKSQNVSLHSANIVQRPLYFAVPQANENLMRLLRFKHRTWRPYLHEEVIAALEQISNQQGASINEQSTAPSLSEVQRLATGPVLRLARMAHWSALDIAAEIGLHNEINGPDDEITKDTITRELSSLDQCILAEDFGSTYIDAMSDTLLSALRRKSKDVFAIAGLRTSELVKRALVLALEKCK